MSYYLIGIGGTGARCMESFIHLNSAGLLKDGNKKVELVYVDADVSCGNLTRTQQTAALYKKARQIGFGDTGLFQNEFEEMGFWTPVKEDCDTMDDIFHYTSLVNKESTHSLGLLYDSLYTEEERTTDLAKGFRGHPSIGAAVMTEKMDSNEEPWKSLLPKINADPEAKIFLFASVFGGTGAAGFPTIANLLYDELKKDGNGQCIARIAGALVLPYFQFPPADEDSAQEMQAKVDEFMLNTKSALEYYNRSEKIRSTFTSIYLVGDNDLTEVKKFSLGSGTQKNEAHFIEMYAALAAVDFFNKDEYQSGLTVPMVARSDENNDKIEWKDLPGQSIRGKLRNRLGTMARVLYAYQHGVMPSLQECSSDEKAKRKVAWYKDLVEKQGKIDVYQNPEIMQEFQALSDYADRFFTWLGEIISNPKRDVGLINPQACNTENLITQQFPLALEEIVIPAPDSRKYDYKKFWQELCGAAKHADKNGSLSGKEYLMQAVYNICKDVK